MISTRARFIFEPRRSIRYLSAKGPSVKKHSERMRLPYTAAQVYAVVEDVGSYKEFVPWCLTSRMLPPDFESAGAVKAELEVGFGVFKEKYTSLISLNPPRSIEVRSADTSVLDFLETKWQFLPIKGDPQTQECWVTFNVQFRFKSQVHDHVSGYMMDQIVQSMGQAFRDRCRAMYAHANK